MAAFLRYGFDREMLARLDALIPDADVSVGQRKIQIGPFPSTKALHAFLDRVIEADEDIDPRKWYYHPMVERRDDGRVRVRLRIHVEPEQMARLVAALAAATAA